MKTRKSWKPKAPPKQLTGRWRLRRFTEEEAMRFAEFVFAHGRELGLWRKIL